MDKKRMQDVTTELIEAIGEDPKREGLRDTPRRVADMFAELTQGYAMNPKEILAREWSEVSGMVVAKNIGFFSLCEHHLLPFHGNVHIGYIPSKAVVGLSKLVRLVDCFSQRLQLQERMTKQIADALNDNLRPLGVVVVVQARHLCMEMRGVKSGADILTSEIRGQFEKFETRNEFFNMLRKEV
ncbi:MAG TPA: GTP cyclohydrolase I FolE [Candidatus Acidoferrales bacterium]|nr:GTP cyclohydrolase I FolE [Candidatus Acidoferrales bacterium]